MTPLVSVIMPVYNQEKYLAETIESVLSQTYNNFEFIIIDDGSKDASMKIIADYATKDKRIIPIYQSNHGKPSTLNFGATKANGDLLAFLDHDDLMLPERLAKQVAFHQRNSEIDASSCHCYYISAKGNFQGIQRFPFVKTIEESRTAKSKIINCAFTGLMISKKSYLNIGGLRSQFWPCDDIDFFNRLIDNNNVLVIIQEILMKYRVHASATSVRDKWHMFQMIRYTHYCIELRRAGKSEITFNDYNDIRQKEPWWVKLDDRRYHYSLLFHKKASLDFYSKNYISFTWSIAAASLLSPKFVYWAALTKIKKLKAE